MKQQGVPWRGVDYLYDTLLVTLRCAKAPSYSYVDEVQDNLLIDTMGMVHTSSTTKRAPHIFK